MLNPTPRILIIAGSDSGGGAGIQGDLKTVTCLGGYAMTAITALTAQNTHGVFGIHEVPPAFIAQQIQLCLSDIGADAIKTGMLHSTEVIAAVAEIVASRQSPVASKPLLETKDRRLETSIPLILDPVMVAKGGAPLLQPEAVDALKTLLIPRATLITPNIPEAELLLGRAIPSPDAMPDAAQELLGLGCEAVLLKGGHMEGDTVTDILATRHLPLVTYSSPRIASRSTHGTGCTLASAIATFVAQHQPLSEAVAHARAYVQQAIAHAPALGGGHGPLGHNWALKAGLGRVGD